MSKRSDKRKRRMDRAKSRAKLMAETMRRLSPGSQVTWKVDSKRQKSIVKVVKKKSSPPIVAGK